MKLMNTHKSKELDDLPEDILLYILCLLPLKDAVRTSALSRGWKHLWTCTPTFNFNSPILTNMGIPAVDQNAKLVHLIYTALRFRDSSSLSAFHLHFSLEEAKEILILSSWIMDASLKYNVQYGPCAIELPSPSRLPCLKALHLKGVELKDDEEKLRKLFSHPTLEVLEINECSYSVDLYIVAPKFRKLYISEVYGKNMYQVQIHGCSLEYFRYVGPRFCVSALSLSAIATAVVHIMVRFKDWERSSLTAAKLCKLLEGLSSVKSLELSSNLVEQVKLSQNVEKKDYILDPIPSCCELHLKNIIMLDFGSTEEEWSFIGILLATPKVLENIVLQATQCEIPMPKMWPIYKKEVLNSLRKLPRASRRCKFSIL